MFYVLLKVAPNIIGSQHKESIVQELNVTLNIISDHCRHMIRFLLI